MSSQAATPDMPLLASVVYLSGYPIVAGSFFAALFGSRGQSEYLALKERFGTPATVGFFARFDSFFGYALEDDPSAQIFSASPVQPKPDPTVDLSGFVAALNSAGTAPGTSFNARVLLDALVTPAICGRAYDVLDRTHGAGSAIAFERLFGAIVVDAGSVAG
jgi:hypothetical protein